MRARSKWFSFCVGSCWALSVGCAGMDANYRRLTKCPVLWECLCSHWRPSNRPLVVDHRGVPSRMIASVVEAEVGDMSLLLVPLGQLQGVAVWALQVLDHQPTVAVQAGANVVAIVRDEFGPVVACNWPDRGARA